MASALVIDAQVFIDNVGNDVCSPFFDKFGNLFLFLQNSAEVMSVDKSGELNSIHCTNGQPSGAVFDETGTLYIADFAHTAILAVQPDGQQDLVVGVYEDKTLKGPNTIVSSSGSLFFTDSGPFGETGLHNPTGSVFCITNSPSGQILKPISLGNLAYPSGVAVSAKGTFVYVAETMANRVLRFFQQPEGVYHGSVFCQLSGGIGPVALALDMSGRLYVGTYDIAASSNEGFVYVYSKSGKLSHTISVPGPEISGLAISDGKVYITEKSTGSLFTAKLPR